jgi:hypothetical protein
MHWTVQGFSGPMQTGYASDADLDAPVALPAASVKWNDPACATAALSLVSRIREH